MRSAFVEKTTTHASRRAHTVPQALKRSHPERRLALATAIALTVTLAASAAFADATTHPANAGSSSPDSSSFWTRLTANETPAQLPNRGAGAAETTAADASAARAVNSATLTGASWVPAVALAAYRKAAASLAVTNPSCHLTWPLLAGIGKVETDHGRSWGAATHITKSGEVVPTILGPVLDGSHDTAKLLDTDGGALDHDRRYDRAVGPMQFVPATWRQLGRDGNGDGIKDPNNMWDATLAAGGYLCDGGRDLSDPAQERAAILSYNPSTAYVKAVLAWAAAYQRAGQNLPSLEGVPDPLVLGAGGALGEDPFGDAIGQNPSTYDNGSMTSDSYSGPNRLMAEQAVSSKPWPTTTSPAGRSAGATLGPSRTATPTRRPPVPSPSATPSGLPIGSSSQTPTPTATPTPTETPTPTPTIPPCNPGITAQGSVVATPVDWNSDGAADVLRVTVPVTSPTAGSYTVGIRLTDGSGWRVTSTVATVAIVTGSQNVVLDLSGPDIGDAGASGAMSVRVTVRSEGAAASCAFPLLNGASVGSVDASTYAGWSTSTARLRDRLAADISSGQVRGAAASTLPLALITPSQQAPDLVAFRFALMTAQSVTDEERARLDSLAARRMSQGSDSVGNPSYGNNVDPGYDGVG
jgi:membrane-bound lytic murein transglycosylase B